jgi:hypothetical protein
VDDSDLTDEQGEDPDALDLGAEVRTLLKVPVGAERESVNYLTQLAAEAGVDSLQALREWLARKQIQADRSGFKEKPSRFQSARDTDLQTVVKYLRYASKLSQSIERDR